MFKKSMMLIFSLLIFSCFSTNLSALSDDQILLAQTQGLAWLEISDKGDYERAWQEASNTLKYMLSQNDWVKLMNNSRKPLGAVLSRNQADVRTASNPPGVPAGEYVVLVYTSSFANRNKAQELLIMSQITEHDWKPMSYFIKSE